MIVPIRFCFLGKSWPIKVCRLKFERGVHTCLLATAKVLMSCIILLAANTGVTVFGEVWVCKTNTQNDIVDHIVLNVYIFESEVEWTCLFFLQSTAVLKMVILLRLHLVKT